MFLDDASLLHPDNRRLIEKLVAVLEPTRVQIVRPEAQRGGSPVAAFAAAGLVPGLVHGLLAWLAWGWMRGRRCRGWNFKKCHSPITSNP